MRQTKSLPQPSALALYRRSLQVVVSPCWEMALPDVRICKSFPGCLDPCPGGSQSALARFFPWDIGLPHARPSGSAKGSISSPIRGIFRQSSFPAGEFSGPSSFLTFRPPVLLAILTAPTVMIAPASSFAPVDRRLGPSFGPGPFSVWPTTRFAHPAAMAFPSEQNVCRYLHTHRIC